MNSLLGLSLTFSLMGIALNSTASSYQSLHHGPTSHFVYPVQQKSDSLHRYVGTYELAPGQQLTVSLVTNVLYILPPNETAKASLREIGPNKFEVVGEEAHLVFTQAPGGQITAVEIRFGNGAAATGKKL
ncbi:hypothetical protein [Spirosoma jeollabukense]